MARTARSARDAHSSPPERRGARPLLLGREGAVGRHLDALGRELLAHEELERRPGTAPRLEHAVDLPLGEHARIRAARLGPVGELGQAAAAHRQEDALLDGAREALLTDWHVEARLAQSGRE